MKKYIIVMILMACKSFCFADSHHPSELLNNIHGKSDEGLQIYQAYCSSCHAKDPMIRLGAPRIGVLADWEARLKQDIFTLFLHMDEGVGAMPQRGGCFECTDEQLWLAVLAMLPKNEQKVLELELKKHKKIKQ